MIRILAVMLLMLFSGPMAFAAEGDQMFKIAMSNLNTALTAGMQNPKDMNAKKKLMESSANLNNLINKYPDSAFADDSLFLISPIFNEGPKALIVKLEALLARREPQFEEWTVQSFKNNIPNGSLGIFMRVELCQAYLATSQIDKLNKLCDDAIRKYPDKKEAFENVKKYAVPQKKRNNPHSEIK